MGLWIREEDKNVNNVSKISFFSLFYRLQQLFIELVLKQQQEEYESEGLEWVHIDYFNNQIICDLVDLPHKGVLALMDEACLNVGK